MHSKFLAVLGLCVAVSILTAADAAPRRRLGSTNYGRSNKHGHKHHHDQYPSNYRRRLEDANAKESSDYDHGHDDYEHKGYDYEGYGGDCDDYECTGYGYSYGYKSYGDDCDDYNDDYGHGNDYYGFGKGYGYGDYPAYSYGSGYGYGGDYSFYPDYYSYGGISGYGYPDYGYPGFGFPSYFGYESSAGVDAGTKKFDAMTEEGTNNSAEKKASKTPSKETKPKSDVVNKSKTK